MINWFYFEGATDNRRRVLDNPLGYEFGASEIKAGPAPTPCAKAQIEPSFAQ